MSEFEIREREVVFPAELPVDPEAEKAIFVGANNSLYAPTSMRAGFAQVDAVYVSDRAGTLAAMHTSVERRHGKGVDRSYQPAESGDSNTLLAWLPAINEEAPASDAATMASYVQNPSSVSKSAARPNTWSLLTKAKITRDFVHTQGFDTDVATVFARDMNRRAMRFGERLRVARGDLSPFARITADLIDFSQQKRAELNGNSDSYDAVDLFCISNGSKILAAARKFIEEDRYPINSVTTINLSLPKEIEEGLANTDSRARIAEIQKMAIDYSGRRSVGEASKLLLPPDYVRVNEPLLRREIEAQGAEWHMQVRSVLALAQVMRVVQVTRAARAADDISYLLSRGVSVTLGQSHNEPLVENTDRGLPHGENGFHLTRLVGVDGKKVKLIVGEQAGVVAAVAGIGLNNARLDKSAA